MLYCPCKTFEANPRSQKWITKKNNQRRKEMHNLMELELLPEEPVITVSREVCKWTCSFTAL